MRCKIKVAIICVAAIIFAANKALAGFTATGQFCKVNPQQQHPDTLAICSAELDGKEIEIILVGQKPNRVRQVKFQDVTNKTGIRTFQVLNLRAKPLIDPETISIMFVDFNFDGHKDFAITPQIDRGENQPYLFFLYHKETGNFRPNPEMSEIVNPEVIPSHKQIRSYWRKSPSVSGWHFWQWQDNRPYIARKIVRTQASNGSCSQVETSLKDNSVSRTKSEKCQ